MTLPHSHTEAPASGIGGVWHAARRILPTLADTILGRKRPAADDALSASTAGGSGPASATASHSLQGGGLFRKYAALLVALVAGSLIVSAAIEMYYSYGESRQGLIAVQ